MRKPRRNRHHLYPKQRFHGKGPVLRIYDDRHAHWHALWGNKTIDEVIRILIRIRRIKGGLKKRNDPPQ